MILSLRAIGEAIQPRSQSRGWIASLALAMTVCFVTSCAPMKQKMDTAAIDKMEAEAVAEMNQGNFDPAIEKFNKVLAADPQRWKTLNAIGVMHSFKNQLPQAQSFFAVADAASPNNTAILNNWGLALAMDGRYDEAIARLMQAVEASTSNVNREQPEMNLALVYALSGNDKASEMIQRRYLPPGDIKQNMAAYRQLRKDRAKGQEALRKAAGF